jgi:hypothetical protein
MGPTEVGVIPEPKAWMCQASWTAAFTHIIEWRRHMGVLTFSSSDAFGNLIASADLVIDQPFVVGVQNLIWHIDPLQPKDLFDFTTGIIGQINWIPNIPSPNGWGNCTSDNTLMMFFGNGLAPFANLFNVLQLDPDDPDSGNMVTAPSGWGWLFRGKRLPSGPIAWSFNG